MIAKRLTALSVITCFTGFFFFASLAAAEALTLGAGAGYRRMLEEVLKGYEQKTGRKIDSVYGHMGQIVMQAKAAESIGIIVGELTFLKSSGLEFADFTALGQGVVVFPAPEAPDNTAISFFSIVMWALSSKGPSTPINFFRKSSSIMTHFPSSGSKT